MSRVAPQKILCDATVQPGATEWYGKLEVSDIRYEDGRSVTIQDYLGVVFLTPILFDSLITVQQEPWTNFSEEIQQEPYGNSTFRVTAKLSYPDTYTFSLEEVKISFGLNGNLTDNPEAYTNSFELYADSLPSGTLILRSSAAPDAALASSTQKWQLKQTGRSIQLSVQPSGATTQVPVRSGTYDVTADELTTPVQTVVAIALVSPDKVAVTTGDESTVTLTYGAVSRYSALDVTIGNLSSPVDQEQFHVQVTEEGTDNILADFFSPTNRTTAARRLPSSGSAKINVHIILDNVKYFATKR